MNLKLEIEFSKADVLKEVDALKKQIDDMRPLPEDVEGRVMQKLRLDWNYNSNAIEGNKLSYGETVAFLMEGITAKGKPLKDHLDIRGHNEAINFLLSIVRDTRPLSEADIRDLHRMILVEPYEVKAQTAEGFPTTKHITLGEYKTSSNHVQTATGEIHYYASPEETPAKMQELMEWYAEASNNPEIHPVVTAALFHHKFVSIHPFDDGNGRLSRILMNLILMQSGYPPVVVRMDDRRNYYALLNRADKGDSLPFIEYIIDQVNVSLGLYLKAINGLNIEDEEDIEKQIALMKIQFDSLVVIDKKPKISIKETFFNQILPLIKEVDARLRSFDEYFDEVTYHLNISYYDNQRDRASESHLLLNVIDDTSTDSQLAELLQLDNITIYWGATFLRFKQPHNRFNIILSSKLEFDEFGFKFLSFDLDTILKGEYNKAIPSKDRTALINYFISDLKDKMDFQIANGLQ